MDDYKNFAVMTNIYELIAGEQSLMVAKMRGMDDFQMLNGLLDTNKAMAYDCMGTPDGDVFVPYGIVGICKNTKEQALAEEFLKTLMGEEVQKADLTDGFPVNADAYDRFTETSNPNSVVGFTVSEASEDGTSTEPIHFEAYWPEPEVISAMKEKINDLTTPSLSDHVIYTAVTEGGRRVLEGDLSVDEGCDEIVQKVQLYLAE